MGEWLLYAIYGKHHGEVKKAKLGPIRTSRQNRNCPWQNPRTNFVVTIFVMSVASALTWSKSSNCVVGWQLACLKNCFSQSVSLQHVNSQTGHHEGGHNSAAQNSVVYIKDNMPFALNSMKHYDSFCPLRKLQNLVSQH